jgi:hypothetical protein
MEGEFFPKIAKLVEFTLQKPILQKHSQLFILSLKWQKLPKKEIPLIIWPCFCENFPTNAKIKLFLSHIPSVLGEKNSQISNFFFETFCQNLSCFSLLLEPFAIYLLNASWDTGYWCNIENWEKQNRKSGTVKEEDAMPVFINLPHLSSWVSWCLWY